MEFKYKITGIRIDPGSGRINRIIMEFKYLNKYVNKKKSAGN